MRRASFATGRPHGRWGWCALILGFSVPAIAQQGTPARYFIRSNEVSSTAYGAMYARVLVASADNDERTGIVAQLYWPKYGMSAVSAVMYPEQMQPLLGDPSLRVRPDVALRPASVTAGPDWPLNQWTVPDEVDACVPTPPVVYLLDTGVKVDHDDFDYTPAEPTLTFLPGLSFGFDYSTLPPVPIPPDTDPHDHGTRVAGCLGGRTSGLLGPLGGRAQVKSIVIYDDDPGFPLASFASQAIQGILSAVSDHEARRAQPYLKNHASVLVFPHSTTAAAGRLADLDQTVELAWLSGMQVILAAGNEGAPAVEVSPAGAAWGFVDGGNPTRFFFGAKPPTAVWFRAADEFLTIGGYRDAGAGVLALSTATNLNIAGAEAIDVFAPGEAVPCPSATGVASFATGTGTSLATGFSAALATWSAYERPWALPSQIRSAVRAAATSAFGFPKSETPALPSELTYRQWIDHFYPEATATPASRDPEADPEGDGVPNFVEYHCGQDPRFADAEIQPTIALHPSVSGSTLVISMPIACHLGSPGQVQWELQTSSSLVTWTPLATSPPTPVDPAVTQGDGRRWSATAAGPSAPPGAAWFRIRFFAPAPLL